MSNTYPRYRVHMLDNRIEVLDNPISGEWRTATAMEVYNTLTKQSSELVQLKQQMRNLHDNLKSIERDFL